MLDLIIIGAKLGVVVSAAYVVYVVVCGIFGAIVSGLTKGSKKEKENEKKS